MSVSAGCRLLSGKERKIRAGVIPSPGAAVRKEGQVVKVALSGH